MSIARARFKLIPVALLVTLVGYASWASLAPRVKAELNWRELQARKTLHVGIDPGIQPFSFYDANGWNGFDADLAREVSSRLNLQLQSDPVGYDSMYDALQTKRVDIVLSAVSPDPNRTANFAFSQAYFDAGVHVVSTSAIKTVQDLADKRVAVSLGTEADQLVRFWERRTPHLQRLPLADDAAALAALQAGQVDVAVVSVFALASDGVDAHWQVASLSPRPYVIALRREDQRLLSEINIALGLLEQDGTPAKLQQKWIK